MTNEMLLLTDKSNHTSNQDRLLPMYDKIALKKVIFNSIKPRLLVQMKNDKHTSQINETLIMN